MLKFACIGYRDSTQTSQPPGRGDKKKFTDQQYPITKNNMANTVRELAQLMKSCPQGLIKSISSHMAIDEETLCDTLCSAQNDYEEVLYRFFFLTSWRTERPPALSGH